jgi:hypothetical protein
MFIARKQLINTSMETNLEGVHLGEPDGVHSAAAAHGPAGSDSVDIRDACVNTCVPTSTSCIIMSKHLECVREWYIRGGPRVTPEVAGGISQRSMHLGEPDGVHAAIAAHGAAGRRLDGLAELLHRLLVPSSLRPPPEMHT